MIADIKSETSCFAVSKDILSLDKMIGLYLCALGRMFISIITATAPPVTSKLPYMFLNNVPPKITRLIRNTPNSHRLKNVKKI
jgi:hypothetical protein